MTGVLTISEFRAMVPCDLPDVALQLLLDDAKAEIDLRCGELESRVETLDGNDDYVFPSKPVSTVTSIRERRHRWDDLVTLNASEYRLENEGTRIFRVLDGLASTAFFDEGDYRGWGNEVIVTYVPRNIAGEAVRRKRTMRDLVQLALQYESVKVMKAGNLEIQHVNYDIARMRLLRRLQATGQRTLA